MTAPPPAGAQVLAELDQAFPPALELVFPLAQCDWPVGDEFVATGITPELRRLQTTPRRSR